MVVHYPLSLSFCEINLAILQREVLKQGKFSKKVMLRRAARGPSALAQAPMMMPTLPVRLRFRPSPRLVIGVERAVACSGGTILRLCAGGQSGVYVFLDTGSSPVVRDRSAVGPFAMIIDPA